MGQIATTAASGIIPLGGMGRMQTGSALSSLNLSSLMQLNPQQLGDSVPSQQQLMQPGQNASPLLNSTYPDPAPCKSNSKSLEDSMQETLYEEFNWTPKSFVVPGTLDPTSDDL